MSDGLVAPGHEMPWRMSNRADVEARDIADRHYNRQKPGTPQFVPPGRCLVLLADEALWVTSWPFAEWVKHDWPGAWVNSCFQPATYAPRLPVLSRSAGRRRVIAPAVFAWVE